jgi:hypothetical protein
VRVVLVRPGALAGREARPGEDAFATGGLAGAGGGLDWSVVVVAGGGGVGGGAGGSASPFVSWRAADIDGFPPPRPGASPFGALGAFASAVRDGVRGRGGAFSCGSSIAVRFALAGCWRSYHGRSASAVATATTTRSTSAARRPTGAIVPPPEKKSVKGR